MKRFNVYLMVIFCLLPVILLRDFTPDNELRYLSIADEALRNGTFFTFYNHGEIYADKPPLYFWVIMLGKVLLGAHYMWFISLFSIVPALIIVHIMTHWAEEEIYSEYRQTSKLLLSGCGLFLGLMVVMRMDMLMTLFIVLALRSFFYIYKRIDLHRQMWMFPVWMFLALFSKGPMGVLIPMLGSLTFICWMRRWRLLARAWGWRTWLVLLSCCALWFGCVYAEGGSDYLNDLLFHQTFDRAVNSFKHVEPFYFYMIAIWPSMLPWTLMFIGVVGVAVWKKRAFSDLQKYFVSVIVSTFVVLSAFSSKLEVYLLPIFPFLIYLCAMHLSRFKWNHWLAFTIALPAAVFALALPGLFLVGRYSEFPYVTQPFFCGGAVVLTGFGLWSLYQLYGKKKVNRAIDAIVCGLFLAVFVGAWDLPSIASKMGYGEVSAKAVEVAAEKGLTRFGYYKMRRAENVDVYLKHPVEALTREQLLSGTLSDEVVMMKRSAYEELKDSLAAKDVCLMEDYAVLTW